MPSSNATARTSTLRRLRQISNLLLAKKPLQSTDQASMLRGLLDAADAARGRSMRFAGIRFTLRRSLLWLEIRDPDDSRRNLVVRLAP